MDGICTVAKFMENGQGRTCDSFENGTLTNIFSKQKNV